MLVKQNNISFVKEAQAVCATHHSPIHLCRGVYRVTLKSRGLPEFFCIKNSFTVNSSCTNCEYTDRDTRVVCIKHIFVFIGSDGQGEGTKGPQF